MQLRDAAAEPAAIDHTARRVEQHWRQWAAPERATRCLLTDAQYFLALEHGFGSWPQFVSHLAGLNEPGSQISAFETAADAIVAGDAVTLRALLRAHPGLVHARSTRAHRSTLLHYISANGVEDYRQKTPRNILELTQVLMDAGADVNAESEAYGGGSTVLGLTATSIHPETAGVQTALLEVLLRAGASGSVVAGTHGNRVPNAAVPAAQRWNTAVQYIARSTTICAGVVADRFRPARRSACPATLREIRPDGDVGACARRQRERS